MLSQLEFHVIRYRLGLASSSELRQVAKTAIDLGTYSPSLVDAAFDAEERLAEIGSAFEKALQELGMAFPESEDDCRWALLRYHISQIANGVANGETENIHDVLEEIMYISNFEKWEDGVYDLYSIYHAVHKDDDYYYSGDSDDYLMDIFVSCKAWLSRHPA